MGAHGGAYPGLRPSAVLLPRRALCRGLHPSAALRPGIGPGADFDTESYLEPGRVSAHRPPNRTPPTAGPSGPGTDFDQKKRDVWQDIIHVGDICAVPCARAIFP